MTVPVLAVMTLLLASPVAATPAAPSHTTADPATTPTPAPDAANETNATDVDPWIAPKGRYDDLRSAADIRAARRAGWLTRTYPPRGERERTYDGRVPVAAGDVVVYRIDSPRLARRLTETDADPRTRFLTLVNRSVVSVGFEQTTGLTMREWKRFALYDSVRRDGFDVVVDRANGTVSVVAPLARLRTVRADDEVPLAAVDESRRSVRDGEPYQFSLTLETNDSAPVRWVDDDEFQVVERVVRFDTDGTAIRLEAADDQRITGSTSVATGTVLTARLRTDDGSYTRRISLRVDANRTFATALDLSDAPADATGTLSVPGVETEIGIGPSGSSASDTVLVTFGAAETAALRVDSVDSDLDVNGALVLSAPGFVVARNATAGDGLILGQTYVSRPGTNGLDIALRPTTGVERLQLAVYRDVDGDGRLDAADEPFRRAGDPVRTAVPVPFPTTTPTARTTTASDPTSTSAARTAPSTTPTPARSTPTARSASRSRTAPPTTTTGAGFGVTLALVAALVGALVTLRRR